MRGSEDPGSDPSWGSKKERDLSTSPTPPRVTTRWVWTAHAYLLDMQMLIPLTVFQVKGSADPSIFLDPIPSRPFSIPQGIRKGSGGGRIPVRIPVVIHSPFVVIHSLGAIVDVPRLSTQSGIIQTDGGSGRSPNWRVPAMPKVVFMIPNKAGNEWQSTQPFDVAFIPRVGERVAFGDDDDSPCFVVDCVYYHFDIDRDGKVEESERPNIRLRKYRKDE